MTSATADTILQPRTQKVLKNMCEALEEAQKQALWPTGYQDMDTEEEFQAAVRRSTDLLQEMQNSFLQVMKLILTEPGVRLWPDNGREDCLSLSGVTYYGMSFGIIWREKASGLGTWTVHS